MWVELNKLCVSWVNCQLNVELALTVGNGALGSKFGAAKIVQRSIVLELVSNIFKSIKFQNFHRSKMCETFLIRHRLCWQVIPLNAYFCPSTLVEIFAKEPIVNSLEALENNNFNGRVAYTHYCTFRQRPILVTSLNVTL